MGWVCPWCGSPQEFNKAWFLLWSWVLGLSPLKPPSGIQKILSLAAVLEGWVCPRGGSLSIPRKFGSCHSQGWVGLWSGREQEYKKSWVLPRSWKAGSVLGEAASGIQEILGLAMVRDGWVSGRGGSLQESKKSLVLPWSWRAGSVLRDVASGIQEILDLAMVRVGGSTVRGGWFCGPWSGIHSPMLTEKGEATIHLHTRHMPTCSRDANFASGPFAPCAPGQ